jgi:hypothetical protein
MLWERHRFLVKSDAVTHVDDVGLHFLQWEGV